MVNTSIALPPPGLVSELIGGNTPIPQILAFLRQHISRPDPDSEFARNIATDHGADLPDNNGIIQLLQRGYDGLVHLAGLHAFHGEVPTVNETPWLKTTAVVGGIFWQRQEDGSLHVFSIKVMEAFCECGIGTAIANAFLLFARDKLSAKRVRLSRGSNQFWRKYLDRLAAVAAHNPTLGIVVERDTGFVAFTRE